MITIGSITFDENAFADAVSLANGDPVSDNFNGLIGSSNQNVANIGTSNNSPDILVEFTDNAAVNGEGADVFIYVPGEVFAVVASLNADFAPETSAQAAIPTEGSEVFFDDMPLNPFSFNPNSVLLALDLDDLGLASGDTVSSLFLRRGDIEGAIYGVGAANNGPAVPVDPIDPVDPVDPVAPVDPPAPIGPTPDDDTLIGTELNDTINALAGDDNVSGLAGDDLLIGGGGNDSLKGAAGDDRLRGNGGDDTVKGGGGDDNLKGNGGDDIIRGNGGNDVIRAGGGEDNVKGGGGADLIFGGGGADQLNGGGGADTLRGNGGDDTLKGNGGADVFQFRASDRNDTISDFRQSQDKIQIQSGASDFADLDIQQDGRDVLIGFGAGQIRVVTDNAGAFDESDFIF